MNAYKVREGNNVQRYVGKVIKLPLAPKWDQGNERLLVILKVITPATTQFLECEFRGFNAYVVRNVSVGSILKVRGNRASVKVFGVDGASFGVVKFIPDSVVILGEVAP